MDEKKQKNFDNFSENIDRIFVLDKNGLYCVDEFYKIAVSWIDNEWVQISYDKAIKAKQITPQKASTKADCPPWNKFDLIIKEIENKTKEYWENLIATTTKKVIGYTNASYSSDAFFDIENGKISPEEYASIIKDFREHEYFFSGEDFQDSYHDCAPVLENYKYVDFSRRGFGGLIAKSLGDYSAMGYCNYTESMFINPEKSKYPKGGLYKDILRASKEIEIDENIYNQLISEQKEKQGVWICIPIPKSEKGFYWESDIITAKYKDKNIKVQIKALAKMSNNQEYITFQQNRRKKFTPWQDNFSENAICLVSPNIENIFDDDENFLNYI